MSTPNKEDPNRPRLRKDAEGWLQKFYEEQYVTEAVIESLTDLLLSKENEGFDCGQTVLPDEVEARDKALQEAEKICLDIADDLTAGQAYKMVTKCANEISALRNQEKIKENG